ncbi:coiled-coil domain-containing protein 125 isoform X1 [Varanus komodoensis]|uniref:coiled-coil domain-containing protein 125 isoform X1 n=1 Tax=Varanus komodoensis TaxID=61221 RepID=UPI001CF7882C|nr:coiled-coil domain-containing protein 125 isoform X1 [Varanus komodoensis]XP_044301948.1 coiled-coil domain-containing protein 125 isoform X1 [Varanus komodoensis]XP_044301949.1 coiled-coil domain-containing protein 125 isoform X1 [Varanus komodoensis]XP_044301950.1 coiled-coil domain-containing protein 125 isoform X1 [Varanus komodoensis]XP_044301951.1 coiled-coil domain-containing protein 125 isoform X1 [Varanus komodoensis]XP_044301952.1 coiled-coil domain-containing protein 125 isoform 
MSEAVLLQNKWANASEGEDDDMACGDLGNGLTRRCNSTHELEGFNTYTGRPRSSTRKSLSPSVLANKGEDSDGAIYRCSKCHRLNDVSVKQFGGNGFVSCTRQNSSESNSEVSNEELKQHLQEVLEEVEILRVELEASQRQLEGKEQALKILQGMEINVLQWEIKINQEKSKNLEETWAEKYERIYCENAALKETLKLKIDEIKALKSENELLDQQRLEILAMLDVKQQKIMQENMSLSKSGVTEITGLDLAVLGACTCNGPEGEPCSCAKMSAATRKQLLQLKQEFELLKKSKEEAYIMADAFRIAFEQQLMRRKDQALRLAQMSKICRKDKLLNWKSTKEDGVLMFSKNRKSWGEKLMGMLASGTDSKKVEELHNPQEIIRMLIDLVNDKEEALAHQRKVSYMLARALEEKDDTLRKNTESNFSEEELALKSNQCKKDGKPQELIATRCSSYQTCISQDGSCCISNTCPDRILNCTSMNSCSLTSEENCVAKMEETAETNGR